MDLEITEEDLREPLTRWLGDPAFTIESWTVERRYQSNVNGFNGGIYYLAGRLIARGVTRPWCLMLKIVTNENALKVVESAAQGQSWPKSHPRYPAREAFAYQSSLTQHLPRGLTAPQYYGHRLKDSQVWLWLEWIETDASIAMGLEDYCAAANALGRWQGDQSAIGSILRAPWLATHVLEYFSQEWNHLAPAMYDAIPGGWAHPLLQHWVSPNLQHAYERYAHDRDAVLNTALGLPHVLNHGAFYSRNLLPRLRGGVRELVVVDWGFTGLDWIGNDAGQLVLATIAFGDAPTDNWPTFFEQVIASYIDGLFASGWRGSAAAVRFGAAATAVIRWAALGVMNVISLPVRPLPWLPDSDPARQSMIERHLRLSEWLLLDMLPQTLAQIPTVRSTEGQFEA